MKILLKVKLLLNKEKTQANVYKPELKSNATNANFNKHEMNPCKWNLYLYLISSYPVILYPTLIGHSFLIQNKSGLSFLF